MEHLEEPLHIWIQATGSTSAEREAQLRAAQTQIEALLVPPPGNGIDEHKAEQLNRLQIVREQERRDFDDVGDPAAGRALGYQAPYAAKGPSLNELQCRRDIKVMIPVKRYPTYNFGS